MSCNGGKQGYMMRHNCMKKFKYKASLEQSGLSNALCKHFERPPRRFSFLQPQEPIVFPQSLLLCVYRLLVVLSLRNSRELKPLMISQPARTISCRKMGRIIKSTNGERGFSPNIISKADASVSTVAIKPQPDSQRGMSCD